MQNIYPDLMITMISGNNKKKMYFSRFQLYAYPGCQRLFSRGFRFLSSFYSDPRKKRLLEQSAIALIVPIQSLAQLNQLVQILDTTADWLLTTREGLLI